MKLHLESLEARSNPSNLIPGWSGGEQHAIGHFNRDALNDTAAVALEGGSVRVVVLSGTEGSYGPILLDTIVFDPSFRGGGSIEPIHGTYGPTQGVVDRLLVVPGVGGGPVVAQFDFNDATGALTLSSTFFAPYSESYRGGLRVSQADVDGDQTPEAIFLPAEGGGPQLVAVDMVTHETELSIWVGDQSDRSGAARFEPTGALANVGLFLIQYGETDPSTLRAEAHIWSFSGKEIQ